MRINTASKLLLLLLFISVGQASAQNIIIGKITDKKTGQPLEEVKVYWRLEEKQKEFSDEEGVFRIQLDANIRRLVFEKSGKEKLSIEVDKIIMDSLFWELDVVMEDQEISTNAGSHWEQSVYEIPASTVIIDREEIERNGYMTVQEILENVPGFYAIDHRSESDVTLGVRGFWAPFNRNVMVLVNGVNMLSERQNDFPMNKINVPVESIQRVEIVRGPLSVIYGAGAFFGVINIITIDPLAEEVSGHISSGWGTQNNFVQNFQYGLRKDGLLLSLNAMNSMRDGFQQPWDSMISNSMYASDSAAYSNVFPFDTTTAFHYKGQITNPERYSKRRQSLNFALRYNKFTANVNYARSDFGFSFLHPGPEERNSYQSNTINLQFGYGGETQKRNWKKNKDVTSQFSYEAKVSHINSLVDASYKYFLPNSFTPGQDRVATLRTEANTLWTIASNEETKRHFLLSSGIAYTNNYQNSSTYNAAEFGLRNWYIGLEPGTSLQTKALYSQLDVKVNNWQFVVGGRLEQQGSYAMLSQYNLDYNFSQQVDTTAQGNPIYDSINIPPTIIRGVNDKNNRIIPIPRLAVLYKLADGENSAHYMRAMYSQAFKQSTVVDNASDVMSVFDIANKPYLRPEKISTFEFGYTFNYEVENYQTRETKALMVNVNVFRNNLSDLITRSVAINSSGNYVTQSSNSDRYITNGIELITSGTYGIPRSEGEKPLKLRANINLTYQVTRDFNVPDLEVSFSPNLLGGGNLSFEIGDLKKQTNWFNMGSALVTVGVNYVGAMKAYFQADTTDLNGNPASPTYIGEDTKGYARWSLNFRVNDIRFWKLKNRDIKNTPDGFYANARISNLFSRDYYYPTYTINPWADRGMLGRPRQILVTIGYKF